MGRAQRLALAGVTAGAGALGVWAARALRPPPRLSAVPRHLTTRAVVPGIPNARYWVALDIEPFVRDVLAARRREAEHRRRAGLTGELPPVDLLAISGGGDKGAFGSGLLNGWTKSGTRPTFKAVTGISTGALIAPVAFLGPSYDGPLREEFTEVCAADVMKRRSLLAVIGDDGLADNEPLLRLLSKHVDEAMLAAVAEEHHQGRMLLIGTTALDACQPVIWNMGNIAASGAPAALELFRSIMLASTAIPGAFPPGMIRVEVDGEPHDEMHVDGGAVSQVFIYPPGMPSVASSLGEKLERAGRVFVIRNGSVAPTWHAPKRRTIDIAARAVGAMLQSQSHADLFRIHQTAHRDGFEFHLACIGADFEYEGEHENFDRAQMNALYDYGYRLARDGFPWLSAPPMWTAPRAQQPGADL